MVKDLAVLVALGSTAGCLALAGLDKDYVIASAEDAGTDAPCVASPSDPHNCGVCGRDCLDGTCTNGVCDPIAVASSVAGGDLVVSPTNVYITDLGNGNVLTTPLNVNSPLRLAQSQSSPLGIALDEGGTQLFWANIGGGQIQALDLVGDGGVRTVVSGLLAPTNLTVTGGRVYYTMNDPDGGVGSVRVDGVDPSPLASGQAQSIAVVGSVVYFTQSQQGQVMRSDGGATQAIAQGQAEPQGIAADSAGVYWANHGINDERVMVLAANDTQPREFQKSLYRPVDVAIDATTVYWVDDEGFVYEAPRAGGASLKLTKGPGTVSAIAIDATRVYWMAGGAVWRVAKW